MSHTRMLGAGFFIVLGLSGCPVTDDYFIDATHPGAGNAGDMSGAGTSTGAESTGGSDSLPQGGKAEAGTAAAQGGTPQAGSGGSNTPNGGTTTAGETSVSTAGSPDMGGAPSGGAPDPGQGGAADGGAGGTPPSPCVPSNERCNGRDDNCNDSVDELVCNSNQSGTQGCFGFVLADNEAHGYMLCTLKNRNYAQAKQVCAGQDMRLAWLESAGENNAVSLKVAALTNEADVLFGATDQVTEGFWFWDGGFQFWKGDENGAAVGGSFFAWTQGTAPDNNGNGEDCGVFAPKTSKWNDRSCMASYPFLCEEKN